MSRRLLLALLVVFALVGLADSAYLTWDHAEFAANPTAYGGGMCGVASGCHEAHRSAVSALPLPGLDERVPVALIGFSFYVVFLGLLFAFSRARESSSQANIAKLLRILASLATGAALSLFVFSLTQGWICQFCAILYVVNPALMVLAWRLDRAPAGLGQALLSRAALLTALSFLLVGAVGFLGYGGWVARVRAERPAASGPVAPLVVDTAARPTQGPAAAPVHIVEFADFECPHCKIGFHALEEVARGRDDIRVTFLNFPLDQACNRLVTQPFHERACELAFFGECAHAQGRFFDVAPLLFEKLPAAALLDRAVALGLDRAALEACLASEAPKARVRGDVEAGIAAELQGTPALYMNGVKVGGARTPAELRQLIEEAKARPASSATPATPGEP